MTVIRLFEPDDLEFAHRQKSREGWAASRDQFKLYPEHDPDGCFVAMADDQSVGILTTTCFGPSGWIGNLIVEPSHRGRGIGRALMEHGLDRLRDRGTVTVRLDADPPGIPLYRRLGFVDEYESCRLMLPRSKNRPTLDESVAETMNAGDLDEVAALDEAIAGANRRRFLGLKMSVAELAIVLRRKGRIVASLLAASTNRGFRIGPSVALDPGDARCLIGAAVSAANERPVLIGLPARNTDALDMLAAMGFEPRPSSFRMRLGPLIDKGDPTRVFAISSGAVG